MNVTAAVGLRERKKAETRQRITAAGQRLFAEHGFDRVTVAQVAAAADVSAKTVFNYFPAKEGIFFADFPPGGDGLVRAVRERGPGRSAYDVVRRWATTPAGLGRAVRERARGETVYEAICRYRAVAPPPQPQPATAAAVYAGSATLQAYVREQFAALEQSLAGQLAAEAAEGPAAATSTPTAAGAEVAADPRPAAVAAALVAPLRWRFTARLAGTDAPLEPAYDLLAPALADYARR